MFSARDILTSMANHAYTLRSQRRSDLFFFAFFLALSFLLELMNRRCGRSSSVQISSRASRVSVHWNDFFIFQKFPPTISRRFFLRNILATTSIPACSDKSLPNRVQATVTISALQHRNDTLT